jgi:hypothetical protein
MAKDIRTGTSRRLRAADKTVDDNLSEMEALIRELLHKETGGEELALEDETNRIVEELVLGLRQPGARIVVVSNANPLPPTGGSGAAPLALGAGAVTPPPAPLAPAPTAPSPEEELGKKLMGLTSAPEEALKIIEEVMRLGVTSAGDVTACISAFQPAAGSRQYHDLIAFTGELATNIGRGSETIRTVPSSGGGARKVLLSVINAQGATAAIQSQLNTLTAAIFGGTNLSYADLNDQIKQSTDRVSDLLGAETDFEKEIALHTGEGRNTNEDIKTYVSRALNGRRTPATAGALSGADLDKIGAALRMPRPAGNNDGQYHTHLINQIEEERKTAKAFVDANGIPFVDTKTIGKLYSSLINDKNGRGMGRLGMGGTIQMPIITNP